MYLVYKIILFNVKCNFELFIHVYWCLVFPQYLTIKTTEIRMAELVDVFIDVTCEIQNKRTPKTTKLQMLQTCFD